jgi:hypothetical protein
VTRRRLARKLLGCFFKVVNAPLAQVGIRYLFDAVGKPRNNERFDALPPKRTCDPVVAGHYGRQRRAFGGRNHLYVQGRLGGEIAITGREGQCVVTRLIERRGRRSGRTIGECYGRRAGRLRPRDGRPVARKGDDFPVEIGFSAKHCDTIATGFHARRELGRSAAVEDAPLQDASRILAGAIHLKA